MKTNYQNVKQTNIFDQYRQWKQGNDLRTVLIAMGLQADLPAEKSVAAADCILETVRKFDNLSISSIENTQERLETLFRQLDSRELEERVLILRRIALGLRVCMDDSILSCAHTREALQEKLEQRYQETYPTVGYLSETEDETLRNEIVGLVSGFNLSSDSLDRLTSRLTRTTDYAATASAFGSQGYALKCMFAAELYLQNRESTTIDMAALDACSYTDMQAVADGIHVGMVTEAAAQVMLLGIVLAAGIHSVGLMLAATTAAQVFSIFAGTMLMILGYDSASDTLSTMAGEVAVNVYHLARRGAEAVKDGLQRMKAHHDALLLEEEVIEYEYEDDVIPDYAIY